MLSIKYSDTNNLAKIREHLRKQQGEITSKLIKSNFNAYLAF